MSGRKGVASEQAIAGQAGEEKASDPRWLVAGLTVLAAGATLLCAALYARYGEPLFGPLSKSLGVRQFEQGVRFEEAGDYENAEECYRLALEGHFDGIQDRVHTLKRLGTLLAWRESPQAGLPFLEEAYAQKYHPITLYEPLADCLIRVGRLDEAVQVAQAWLSDAERCNDAHHQAQAKLSEGLARLAQGREDDALALFLASEGLKPGGRSGYEAGLILYKRGDLAGALRCLEAFLPGASGERAAYARSLVDAIRAQQTGGKAAVAEPHEGASQ